MPAGVPGVELGLILLKQLVSSLKFTVNVANPPAPSPRLSPATIISVAPARIDAVHENPVPSDGEFVIFDTGIVNVCPPGMMPTKFGVLGNSVINIYYHSIQINTVPLHSRFIPPDPAWFALCELGAGADGPNIVKKWY